MKFGEVDIAAIEFDPKSRDDIPPILRGLQHVYTTPELREAVFKILEQVIPTRIGKHLTEEEKREKADSGLGRPGMEQWRILVLGVLRLGLNTDYDRIHELANHHDTLRQMLGHGGWEDKTRYHLQTIKDNLRLFTPEILEQINQVVVRAGHQLVKKNGQKNGPTATRIEGAASNEEKLHARCDSFVVETNVHFPTDTNLLFDATRKTIEESAAWSDEYALSGWRQGEHHIRQFKSKLRKIQKLRRSTSKDKTKKTLREKEIRKAHRRYLDAAQSFLARAEATRQQLMEEFHVSAGELQMLHYYMLHAYYQMHLIERRVLHGEKIPHHEKIFSIFEPHTEWINKGKAGVPVELGLKVCIVESQHGFILHHQVMEQQSDDQVAVEMVSESKRRFPELASVSMDKGFHSAENQRLLMELLDLIVLPRKGRLREADRQREGATEFKLLRRAHPAVESAINALEVHGLDQCPDHGIDGFKRYVSLAAVARNIHRLGTVLRKQEKEREQRKRGPYKKAA